MFAVTLLIQKTKKVVKLLGFVSTTEEADELIGKFISRYGADYLGAKGYGFGVELAC